MAYISPFRNDTNLRESRALSTFKFWGGRPYRTMDMQFAKIYSQTTKSNYEHLVALPVFVGIVRSLWHLNARQRGYPNKQDGEEN